MGKKRTPEEEDLEYERLFNATEDELEKEEEAPEEDLEDTLPEEDEGEEESEESSEDADQEDDESDGQENDKEKKEEEGPTIEELLQEVKLFEHKERSFNGRVSGLTKQITGLEAQIAALTAEKQKREQKEKADKPLEETEAFKKIKEDFPDIAEAIRGEVDQARKASNNNQPEQPATQKDTTSTTTDDNWVQEQRRLVLEQYPNLDQIAADPFFQEFLDQAPPGVRKLAGSDDAQDVISLIRDVYSPYYFSVFPPEKEQSPTNTETTESSTPEDDGGASAKALEAQKRREESLKDTNPTKDKRVRKVHKEEEDHSFETYEKIFNSSVKKDERESRRTL